MTNMSRQCHQYDHTSLPIDLVIKLTDRHTHTLIEEERKREREEGRGYPCYVATCQENAVTCTTEVLSLSDDILLPLTIRA